MFLDDSDDVLGDIIIRKYKDNFEIVFTKSYKCFISDFQEKYCVIEHTDKNKVFDVYLISYEDLGVENIDELFLLLIKEPGKIIKILTENDIPIHKLIIEYYRN